jgi:hypothetical protein
MAVQSTARPTGSRPGIAVALHLVLRLLALLVFAQAVFAGLYLDGNATWRQWHAVNGMLLIPLLALLAVVLTVVLWRSGGPGWIALASVGLLLATAAPDVTASPRDFAAITSVPPMSHVRPRPAS